MLTKNIVDILGTVLISHAAAVRRSLDQLQVDDPVLRLAHHARIDELNAMREELGRLPVGEPVDPASLLPELDRAASGIGQDSFARELGPGIWQLGICDSGGNEHAVTLVRAGSLWRVQHKPSGLDVAMELNAKFLAQYIIDHV